MNIGEWRTYTIFFPDTLTHLLRAEPLSFFSPSQISADSAHIVSDRDAFLDGVDIWIKKLELRLDHVTQEPTTFYFLNGSVFHVDEIFAQGNAIGGDGSSYITLGANGGFPVFHDIHIKGETLVGTNLYVEGDIVIEDTLRIIDNWTNNRIATVTGDIINQGVLIGNNHGYIIEWNCAGNVRNEGVWQGHWIVLTGGGTKTLYTDLNQVFYPKFFDALDATVVSASPLRFDDSQVRIKNLNLQPGHDLYLQVNTTLWVDSLIGNANRVQFNDASKLQRAVSPSTIPVFKNVHLDGTARLITNAIFEDVVVDGILQIENFNYNNYQVTTKGIFENKGSVALNNWGYGLLFDIEGNLKNKGDWQSASVEFMGNPIHYLFTDPSYLFSPGTFTATQAVIISDTTVRFDDGTIRIKKLVLQPGHDLILNQHALLRVDTLEGNNNTLYCNDTSELWYTASGGGVPIYRNINLDGTIRIGSEIIFDEQVTVNGTLKLKDGNYYYRITVTGDVINNGNILPNNYNNLLVFTVEGDLQNNGVWQSLPIDLKGHDTQQIGIPDSANFQAELKIYAMRSGNQYQWLRNGVPLSNGGNINGATSNVLSIQSVTPNEYGVYRCQIDSSGNLIYSRDVIIGSNITGIKEEQIAKTEIPERFSLLQNYPNPFNPNTTIRFQIPHSERVEIKIYDLLGQTVRTLTDQVYDAGQHTLVWDGRNDSGHPVSSGIYLYTMKAGNYLKTRRMQLLR